MKYVKKIFCIFLDLLGVEGLAGQFQGKIEMVKLADQLDPEKKE